MSTSESLSTIESKKMDVAKFGQMVISCKFPYSALYPILQEKKYKYLVLQFCTTDFSDPKITSIAYPAKNGYEFGPLYELEPVKESYLDVAGHSKAFLGNNIVNLDELREILGKEEFDYLQFEPMFTDSKNDWDHVVYEITKTKNEVNISIQYTTDPCPTSCPKPPSPSQPGL